MTMKNIYPPIEPFATEYIDVVTAMRSMRNAAAIPKASRWSCCMAARVAAAATSSGSILTRKSTL